MATLAIRRMRASGFSALLVLTGTGCQYPLDDLYAKGDDDAQAAEVPEHLAELWSSAELSDECRTCAREKCAGENDSCLEEDDCLALTQCVAETRDPAGLFDCRAQHREWLSEDIAGRNLGGPFYECVFQDRCDAECGSRDARECVGDFGWPTTSEQSLPFTLRLLDALSVEPAKGVTVRVCRPEDSETCQQLGEEQVTDDDGVVELSIVTPIRSFQGYLELTGGGLYPTLLRLGWPVAREGVMNVTVVDQTSVELSIQLGQKELLDDRGLLQLRAYGCSGVGLRGVSFDVAGADEQTATWYTFGTETLPSFTATETSVLGVGGIINTPAGRHIVSATHADDGEEVSSLTVPVRPAFMTIVLMYPSGS